MASAWRKHASGDSGKTPVSYAALQRVPVCCKSSPVRRYSSASPRRSSSWGLRPMTSTRTRSPSSGCPASPYASASSAGQRSLECFPSGLYGGEALPYHADACLYIPLHGQHPTTQACGLCLPRSKPLLPGEGQHGLCVCLGLVRLPPKLTQDCGKPQRRCRRVGVPPLLGQA